MNVVAIVQARMTSSRLPGKVLMDLGGVPMLARVVERAAAASLVDLVVVACTNRPEDDPIADWCAGANVAVFRGSEADVLGRFVGAAAVARADLIVRLTADCPFLDPAVIDLVAGALIAHPDADYAANVLERSYPRGLDVEAFTRDALLRMDRLGRSPAAREHVTIGPRLEHQEAFRSRSVRADRDDSDLRWTVDSAADLEFARAAYRAAPMADGDHRALISWCRQHPELARRDDHDQTWDPTRAARAASPETV
jgi:spore coat polysaccharide biosynthesis protein SpsF (cytidylyltransferase family)